MEKEKNHNFTKEMVESIYLRNYGSSEYYKRSYCDSLIYTEGIRDFQITLNAFWIIECIIATLPKITKISKSVDDGFFIVQISVDEELNKGVFEIFREGYINNKYNDLITVERQEIDCIDLPEYDYKFYLILTQLEPVQFTLLLTSEY